MSEPVTHLHVDAAVNVVACPSGHVHFIAKAPAASIDMLMSPEQARELAGLLLAAAGLAEHGAGEVPVRATH